MPSKRIDQLDASTAATSTDLMIVGAASTGVMSKLPVANLLPFFDVRWYGATGDGSTDDTGAVQDAIDAADAAGGGTVIFPEGTFLTGPLTVGSLTTLQGHPTMSSILKLKASSSGAHISLKDDTTQEVGVRHLYINGNSANQSNANDGIDFTNTSSLINPSVISSQDCHHNIHNVYVTNTKGNGLTLAGRGATHVSQSFFYFAGGHGVDLGAFDCYFANVTTGSTDGHGFYLNGAGFNNNLIGCKAFLADTDGFHLAGVQGNRLAGCCAQGNGNNGYQLSNAIDNTLETCTAMDNNYTSSGAQGVGFYLSSNSLRNRISGSAFDDQGSPTQVAALYTTPGAQNNQIDLVVDVSSHTTGLIYSGSNVAGNSVRINGMQADFYQFTYAATWTPDLALGRTQAVTLTGNITINRPIGSPLEGTEMTIIINQDGTGGRTITWGSGFVDKFWAPDTLASSISSVRWVFRQNNWYVLGGPNARRGINNQTGTSYTSVTGDQDKLITLSNGSAITWTIPPNSSVAYPIGCVLEAAAIGAGQVTITPGSGVTINGYPGLKSAGQYARFAVTKTATDTWLAEGALTT